MENSKNIYLSNVSQALIFLWKWASRSPCTFTTLGSLTNEPSRSGRTTHHVIAWLQVYFDMMAFISTFAHRGVSTAHSLIMNFTDAKRSHVEQTNYLSVFIHLYQNFLFPSRLSWFIYFILYDFTCIKTVDGNVVNDISQNSCMMTIKDVESRGVMLVQLKGPHMFLQFIWLENILNIFLYQIN